MTKSTELQPGIWTELQPGIWAHGPYTVYRNPRSFDCFRWAEPPKLLGKCESFLEAKLLASLDQALQDKPMDGPIG